ncbi:o-succinylbenzoate--CoA ligase [Virgibacillus sp. YIM 98842]|uniref:o-succinylbenzoate--CoA ligase n=1 Tax=Virgibacillus sp. YIM 98842 TaxID=2663533 RepID=UPI0013DB7CC3|nr:o-succinylbenzoate--CoA ligase [Virgibacillus sp. YIM 98842]
MQDVIPHWLTRQADISPNKTAVELSDGTTVSFKRLKEESQQYARKLASIGVGKNCHVGILSSNALSMVIAIHGISYLGAVAVLLNTKLANNELRYQVNDADVSVLLTNDEMKEKGAALDVPAVKAFSEVNKMEEKPVQLNMEISLNDPFTIMYTSGTTGFPKGVIHTYGNHWWSAIGSLLNLGLSEKDKWLAALPVFHVSGLSILIRSVVYGMPVYLLGKFEAETVQEAIMKQGVTIVSAVTVMLQQLVDQLGEHRYPAAFRCILLGGGPVPKVLLKKAKEKNVPVIQSFGMTETASQIITLSASNALEKLGSAGKPLFPAQLKINNAGEDGVGEILVKGPMVTTGYYKKEEENLKAFKDGWLATGDLGYTDGEGFLYVVDRRKDLIISGGENVYPSEIESVLTGMQGVKEAGVTGKDDPKWGKVPAAFIVRENDKLTEAEVRQYANTKLAGYKVPAKVYFVDELPRNASNKLVRDRLWKLLQ